MNQEYFKVILVGDSKVGKTSLLYTYIENIFPGEYVQPVMDPYDHMVYSKNLITHYVLHDTTGLDLGDQTRSLCYPGAQLFVLVYACDDPASLHHLETKWIPEIYHYNPDVPYILVATKMDLRKEASPTIDSSAANEDHVFISSKEGKDFSLKIGAKGFYETSALTDRNVVGLFDTLISQVLKPPKPTNRQSGCNVS